MKTHLMIIDPQWDFLSLSGGFDVMLTQTGMSAIDQRGKKFRQR